MGTTTKALSDDLTETDSAISRICIENGSPADWIGQGSLKPRPAEVVRENFPNVSIMRTCCWGVMTTVVASRMPATTRPTRETISIMPRR